MAISVSLSPSISPVTVSLSRSGRRSVLHPELSIDENNWAVTVADLGPCALNLWLGWAGHAVVVIESLENGTYRMRRGELLKGVRFEETSLDGLRQGANGKILPEDFRRSETWVKAKALVQTMIDEISTEADRGEPIQVPALGWGNCLKWSKRKIALLNVSLPWTFFSLPICAIDAPEKVLKRERKIGSGMILLAAIVALLGGFAIASLIAMGTALALATAPNYPQKT
ncbi:MAG: hypothetical protein HW387_651 [Parachlamydiales bacterium]|nr:hypothetical protein [Parachlamydiales bacterium]